MTTEDLRREARVGVRVPVVLYRGKAPLALETSDVSFKGLFVRTSEPPALMSLVRLKVALFGRELEAHAMAIHVVKPLQGVEAAEAHDPGVGLQFWGLSGRERTTWDDFVRGLVHARRSTSMPAPTTSDRSTLSVPTPTGVHIIVGRSRASST